MAGFEKTAKTSRAGRFPPPRRGPRRRSRLGLLTALDAARRPSPPRPQRGPRRRQRPSPPPVPRPTPVTSTTWRLQPPSASLVLWHKPRNPPSVAACALDPGVDAIAAARSELDPGCPSPPSTARSIGHSTSTAALRRHLTPVYLQPKTKHTAQSPQSRDYTTVSPLHVLTTRQHLTLHTGTEEGNART